VQNCPDERTSIYLYLRDRAKITSHFRISSSGHLRPCLNRKILEIVRLFLWFCSIGAAKSDLNPGANSANLFLRDPLDSGHWLFLGNCFAGTIRHKGLISIRRDLILQLLWAGRKVIGHAEKITTTYRMH